MKRLSMVLAVVVATILLFVNDIHPFSLRYTIPLIVLICAYNVFLGQNILYKKYKKHLALIYLFLFLSMIVIEHCLMHGVYSIYNNILLALIGPMWIVGLYGGKTIGKESGK